MLRITLMLRNILKIFTTDRIMIVAGVLSISYGTSLWVISEATHQTMDPNYASSWELPLTSITGLAVDNDGNIYCGSMSYQRVQIYNPDGKFIKGLFLPGLSNGWFDFQVDSDKLLHIAMVRGNRLVILDSDGRVIDDRKNLPIGYDAEIMRDDASYVSDKHRNLYQVDRSYLLFPIISKTDMYGNKIIVVRQSLSTWLTGAPLPAFGFQIAGILLIGTSYFVAARRRRNNIIVRLRGPSDRVKKG